MYWEHNQLCPNSCRVGNQNMTCHKSFQIFQSSVEPRYVAQCGALYRSAGSYSEKFSNQEKLSSCRDNATTPPSFLPNTPTASLNSLHWRVCWCNVVPAPRNQTGDCKSGGAGGGRVVPHCGLQSCSVPIYQPPVRHTRSFVGTRGFGRTSRRPDQTVPGPVHH